MAVDWHRITAKGTSVRAIVTTCLSVSLCIAFLLCIGSLLYTLVKPEPKADTQILNIVNSVIVLFAATVTVAIQSYFNRNDRTPPPGGPTNA